MGLLRQPTSDITKGVIWKQLLAFFFPLWFGTFFQQLYNTVDTLVVGRFVGKVALAAVGSTSVIVNLTVGIFTGLAAGAVVAIAQHFGARRWDEVHECVHTAMLLSILIGAFFMVTGFVLTPWALRAMGTTEEALPGAILYLRVYFLGMVPNVIYNMGTGVLRAIGDFRRPLYFLMAASLCNIVLDLLLVVVFHMGVAGVAIATICSQLLSAVLVVISLMRSEMTPYQLFPKRLRIYAMPMRSIPDDRCAHRPPVGDVQRLQHRHTGLHQLLWHRRCGRLDRLRQDGYHFLDDHYRHGPVHHHLCRAELRRRGV